MSSASRATCVKPGIGRTCWLPASSALQPRPLISKTSPASVRPMPVPYNGSVARVNFGPLSAARVRRWLRNGEVRPHSHPRAHHAEHLVAGSVGSRAAGGGHLSYRNPAIAIDAIGRWSAASGDREDRCRHRGVGVGPQRRRPASGSRCCGHSQWDPVRRLRPAAESAGSPRPSQQPRLVFIGRLDEPRKGLDVLLAAVPLIRQAHPNLEVIVAGQGSRPLPPGAAVSGTITDEAKIALLGSADIFVAPQLARESFGIVLLEAMASGAQLWPLIFPHSPTCSVGRRTNGDSAKSSPWATTVRSPRAVLAGSRPPRPTADSEGATGSPQLRLVECRHHCPRRLSSGPFRSAYWTD